MEDKKLLWPLLFDGQLKTAVHTPRLLNEYEYGYGRGYGYGYGNGNGNGYGDGYGYGDGNYGRGLR
jgi:hypothetical protein